MFEKYGVFDYRKPGMHKFLSKGIYPYDERTLYIYLHAGPWGNRIVVSRDQCRALVVAIKCLGCSGSSNLKGGLQESALRTICLQRGKITQALSLQANYQDQYTDLMA